MVWNVKAMTSWSDRGERGWMDDYTREELIELAHQAMDEHNALVESIKHYVEDVATMLDRNPGAPHSRRTK
jgi:hypothetical protein